MSYIYSTTPIPSIDTVNSHVGFYFFTGIMVCIFLMCIVNSIERNFSDVRGALFVTVVAVITAAGVSWNTGEIRHYVNEPVIARMHSNGQEVISYTERVHKNNVTKYRLEPFVYYEVDGGVVSFQRGNGQSWPIDAILYRNPAK